MPAVPVWRVWLQRALSLGYSRLLLIAAVLFTLGALANPLWAFTNTQAGGNWSTSTFTWTTVSTDMTQNGAWTQTLTQSYNKPGFNLHAVAASIGASYLTVVVLAILLVVVIALYSMEWVHRLPPFILIIIAVIVVAVALIALFYPVLTVPSTAATDLHTPAVAGFWGSGAVPDTAALPEGSVDPPGSGTWGAGLGWWLLLVAVILGALGAAFPILTGMRAPVRPQPREWQIER